MAEVTQIKSMWVEYYRENRDAVLATLEDATGEIFDTGNFPIIMFDSSGKNIGIIYSQADEDAPIGFVTIDWQAGDIILTPVRKC